MTLIKSRKGWELPESEATDEQHYMSRRRFIRDAALGTIGAVCGVGLAGCRVEKVTQFGPTGADAGGFGAADSGFPVTDVSSDATSTDGGGDTSAPPGPFELGLDTTPSAFKPAKRNTKYTIQHALTPREIVAAYNNFYEFSVDKSEVWKLIGKFHTRPWTIEVSGMVHKPKTYDIDDLLRRMPSEERLYRHRCVEAWAMVVPWTGFQLSALLDEVQPLGSAKYVRFISYENKKTMPGVPQEPYYPWPYYEGLRLDEARNQLTLVGTGLFGHRLPRQDGAPIRIITPWKYGFKSIKSIIKIELTDKQPPTFWHDVVPSEYGFYANVDPSKPHPRWSQATERMIGTNETRPTRLYNGYGQYVASMYTS